MPTNGVFRSDAAVGFSPAGRICVRLIGAKRFGCGLLSPGENLMDLTKMISELRLEEKHIDAAIASLEQFAALRSGITKLPMKAVREIKRVQVQAAGAVDG